MEWLIKFAKNYFVEIIIVMVLSAVCFCALSRLYFSKPYPEFLDTIQVIAVPISIFLLWLQSRNTKKMAEIASRPHISVGIRSHKYDASNYKEAILNTKLIFKNNSNFTAFAWLFLKIEINKFEKDKNGKKYIEYFANKDLCTNKATWELDPMVKFSSNLFTPSILEYFDEYIDADLEKGMGLNITPYIYFSDVRLDKRPSLKKWTPLTAYSFRKDGNYWLKNTIGIEYALSEDDKMILL